MKNERKCGIIEDLLPNYIENLTNDNTNKFIEEHIEECNNCKEKLSNLKTNITSERANDEEIDFLKKINRKYKNSIFIGVIIGLLLLILIYVFIAIYRFYILIDLKSKFIENSNFNNVKFEINSTTFKNFVFEEDKNTKYYCKDGIIKCESSSIKNNTKWVYFIDNNNGVEYTFDENTKKVYSRNEDEISKIYKNNNFIYSIFKKYYDMDTITLLKISFNIFENKIEKKKENDKNYILINYDNFDTYIYDENTGLINSIYSKDLIGNSRLIIYKYEFNSVSDQNIKMPNIKEYNS